MAGEIAAAFIAILPTMKSFGSQMVTQGGPQIRAASARLGAQSGAALGGALGGSASKAALPAINSINAAVAATERTTQNWLAADAQMAVKNVLLYGGMYKAIQGISAGTAAAFDAMVGFNSQLQQADIGFTTLLHGAKAAGTEMAWIQDFAKETPFRYGDVVRYDQGLIAMGFNAEEAHKALTAAGDAAAGLGRGDEGIQRVTLALGQMWTKGKIQSQEMLQLTEAGIGAWQILADKYGASVADVQDAVTNGLIDSKTAVPALIAGIESQFGGLMEKQSTTLAGMWSNIQDTLQQRFAQAGKPLFDELTADAKQFLGSLDDPEVQHVLDGIGHGLADVASGLADVSGIAVSAFGDALPLLEGIASNAKTSLPVLLSLGAAYLALRRAQQGGLGVGFLGGVIAESSAAAAAITSVEKPTRAMVAAQQSALRASINLEAARFAESKATVTATAALETERAATIAATNAADALVAAQDRRAAAVVADNDASLRAARATQLIASGSLGVAEAETEANAAFRASVAAKEALVVADRDLAAAETVARTAVSDATAATAASNIATQDRMVANADLVVSEGAVTAATEKAVVSQQRFAALGAGLRQFAGLGQMLGLGVAIAGVTQLGDASLSTGEKVGSVAEAMGGFALAGAAFGAAGGIVGAAAGGAIGGVVGLTTALINLQAAQDAANKDTSGTADALTKIGVTADTAAKFLADLGDEGLKPLGGSQAVVDAVQKGGSAYDELVAKLQATQKAQEGATAAAEATDAAWANTRGAAIAAAGLDQAKAAVDDTSGALGALRDAATEAAYSQFNAQEAANAATGSYGAQSQAAYEAAQAIGTIPPSLLQTGVAAEGASGMVGYLLNALTGLPVNTPINFSTNATDVLAQIFAIQASIASLRADGDSRIASLQVERMQALQKQLSGALTATVVKAPTLSLPSMPKKSSGSGGNSAATAAANAAKQAAEAAAQKLKQDQQAQLQFADAFGTLMQSALEGNFDQYRDKLTDEIKSLTRDGYQAAADTLKRLSGTLTQASLDYAALTNKIKAATDAESSLTKKMQDQYQSTVDLITGLGKVTDAQSFDQLTYLLGQTTDAATQYQDILKALKDEGLSEELWNQLAGAGPQSLGLAQSILSQGQAGVDQLNSLSGNLVDAADSMGDLVSQSMYQQGVDAMNAYIDGLNSQSSALESQLATIGNNILNQAATAITPGNAGFSEITSGSQTTANNYQVSVQVNASDFGDLQSVQDFIRMLQSAPTTQLVNQAGTVTS